MVVAVVLVLLLLVVLYRRKVIASASTSSALLPCRHWPLTRISFSELSIFCEPLQTLLGSLFVSGGESARSPYVKGRKLLQNPWVLNRTLKKDA